MDNDEMLTSINRKRQVNEASILIREVELNLEVGHESFHPTVRVKIWKKQKSLNKKYFYTVSHHVHTPIQATPYYPSIIEADSEEKALDSAISNTVNYLIRAIEAGHQPSDSWLIQNSEY